MKFKVTFLREFTVDVESSDSLNAGLHILRQFPGCKLLSIYREGYVETPEAPKPTPPRGRPNGGGSPGTPTVKVPELADQIAEKAA